MKILSHRGYWLDPTEKNCAAAFTRSFRLGFGTELDFRDCGAGKLVIAHDPASESDLPAEDFFRLFSSIDPTLTLALNIKADGLQQMLSDQLRRYGVADAFVFDMSVPDQIAWARTGIPIFARQSEVEQVPALYERAAGVWLDSFGDEWWGDDVINAHLAQGKRVVIVSSELHKRDPARLWARLSRAAFRANPNVMLCTDRPTEADSMINA